jgi:hypothetical protein
MAVISSADSLLAIFGYTRVSCATCRFSEGTESTLMNCQVRHRLVDRDDQCNKYEREPGADDE